MRTIRSLPRLIIAAAALLFLGGCGFGKKDYHDSAYEQCHIWQEVEVGIINRLPLWNRAGAGRCAAVVAFPRGRPDQARVLLTTPGGELPRRPEFVGANGAIVSFRVSGMETKLDLTSWKTFPMRSDSSSKPLKAESPPPP